MVFRHHVKYNGKYYSAGTDVPVGESPIENKNDDFSKHMNPPVEVVNEYTKTEINRMSTSDLKKLAMSEKIENSEDMTGAELKKVLIEKFGL